MKLKKLLRSFYLRPTITVAKDLLGKYLVRKIGSKTLIGKIVEVEAYLGLNDAASHTYRGQTKRNEVMFRKGGNLYVYFTYGMHFCANVVTEKEGIGHAVLLRALEPIQGIDIMAKHRTMIDDFSDKKQMADGVDISDARGLTNGPAKLCQAFGIGKKENGIDLLKEMIFVAEGTNVSRSAIVSTTRIGIIHDAEKKWRFYLKGNPFISKK